MVDETILRRTLSLCPDCLQSVSAGIIARDGAVFLAKQCPEHGASELMIWPDVEHYNWSESFSAPLFPPPAMTASSRGCPHDCGPCSRHLRSATLVEVEVTGRCNLRCPVCFMSAGQAAPDAALADFPALFSKIAKQSGTTPGIQLTGGEPTVRADLPQIIRMVREAGFEGVEVNTNGLVIARDFEFLESLCEAGLTGIYLQFDSLNASVYQQLRGADLLDVKLRAIENCRRAGIQVVLAVTVIDGVNYDEIGEILRFSLNNLDVVAGLALQPAFTSGRFDVNAPRRLSMGDIAFALAKQCPEIVTPYDFYPLACSHPLCSSGTYITQQPEGFTPITRTLTPEQYKASFDPGSPQGSIFRDIVAQQGDVPGLSLVVMNYMDALTMDIDRLRECSMLVAAPDGRMLPFCSYHLTDCHGRRVHASSIVALESVR